VRAWYDNGQLRVEESYKDDKLDGVQRCWHGNGRLWREGNYKNGLKVGVHKEWSAKMLAR